MKKTVKKHVVFFILVRSRLDHPVRKSSAQIKQISSNENYFNLFTWRKRKKILNIGGDASRSSVISQEKSRPVFYPILMLKKFNDFELSMAVLRSMALDVAQKVLILMQKDLLQLLQNIDEEGCHNCYNCKCKRMLQGSLQFVQLEPIRSDFLSHWHSFPSTFQFKRRSCS